MIDKLPKRTDYIYQEIESFEDYEYTNCIAYEMAVRNESVKKLNEERDNILSKLLKEEDENLYECFKNIIKTLQSKFYFLEEYLSIDDFRNEDYYTYETPMKIQVGKSKDGLMFKSIMTKDDTMDIPKGISVIDCFKRPMLYLPTEISKNINLQINPNLPKDELIAYISKIKDEYDKDNSIVKNPLEILGHDLLKANKIESKALPNEKNKRKVVLADAFYIYDIWKILGKSYSKKINELETERNIEIESIKKNINYDKYDKRSLIDEIKKDYSIELDNYSKVSLKTEIANRLNVSIDTVDKLHSLMIKYIDKLKYKELITGISN